MGFTSFGYDTTGKMTCQTMKKAALLTVEAMIQLLKDA
jgi:hypothetical protein